MNGSGLARFAHAMLVAAALVLPTAHPAAKVLELRATVTTPTGRLEAALEVDGKGRGYLRITDPSGSVVERTKLVTHHQVLPLLIDRRLSPLWPALLDWAGPSLDKLRSRMLADSEAAFARDKKAYGDDVVAYVEGSAGSLEKRAVLLNLTGSPERAIALLQEATSNWPATRKRGETDQGMLLSMLAGQLFEQGKVDEADRVLTGAPEQLGSVSHLLNTMATHGLMLAEAGRYQQALGVVDATAGQYRSYARSLIGMLSTIPGTQRYFAVTRSCALAGLGRAAEAQAALKPVLGDPEPTSLVHKVPASNSELRLRAFSCLRDPAAFAAAAVQNVTEDSVAPAALVLLQPEYRRGSMNRTVLSGARRDPKVVTALTPITRPLPPELVPALNDWAP
jgi:tetratricopeptide (TPR) repeat protein